MTSIGDYAFNALPNLKLVICSEAVGKKVGYSNRCIYNIMDDLINGSLEQEVVDVIVDNILACLKWEKNNIAFYRFVLDKKWLNAEDVDEVIEFTASIECRAMLLEYKRSLCSDNR